MKIFAIVVTWRGGKWYDRCLGSLRDSEVPVDIIVIDNASGDGSVEYIRERFPSAVLLPQEENLGFAKANNIGIRYAIDHGADYVFLLNQDAWVEKDTIGKLLETFGECPDAGIVSPMHMNGEGTALDWKFATDLSGDFASDAYLGRLKSHYALPFVNAAAWLVSAECIHTVGGFDTNLFVHYGEDGNYCHRLQYHRLRLYVNTGARACHDREFRRNCDSKYMAANFDVSDTGRISELANINYDVDIEGMIRSTKKSLAKAQLRLRFSKVKRLTAELSMFERVKHSRTVNCGQGLLWL